ncbi:DNA-processing protein DprA [Oceanomicrobium pacificus]|uniref:DNA-protecting protein DprA n=1 Tax=Oceanomicrobium pacificus TaxID=2692916 RepID=A0A6B0TQB3_9RHOB|nr:DNA-processing protein DprA [Oceanomicrobium pacificus]MXU66847.1 DNA-protecting protein DprA [Oceanomicrobium pacificus]
MLSDLAFFEEESRHFLPAPPASEAEELARLRLIRSHRVGPMTFRRLMAEHGSAPAALAALPDIARSAGVAAYRPCSEADAQAEWDRAARLGHRPLFLGQPDYPAHLADAPDAPPFLWAAGRLDLLGQPLVALVGARNASALGMRMAARLARDLGAAGIGIVSGLARGIDAAAHDAACPTGTVAVIAGGLTRIAPQANRPLAERIAREGLLLSEMPPDLQPQPRHFPQRNRIIAGLAGALVVVEGATRSGSLITARAALDLGRDVMAVPGHPMDARAGGCNMLIRDGATLVRGAEDILAQFSCESLQPTSPDPVPVAKRTPTPQAEPEQPPEPEDDCARLMRLLGPSPVALDRVQSDSRLPADRFASALVTLELQGRVQRIAGGQVAALP